MINRWDETWHRLIEWTNGPGPSERLAAQILLSEGFSGIDPAHPLGGPDGGKDGVCIKHNSHCSFAAYFPRGQQNFSNIKAKFLSDYEKACKLGYVVFIFITNQELSQAQRKQLTRDSENIVLYHLERITNILDQPSMATVRLQFLNIDAGKNVGIGGEGGSCEINGDGGTIIGGRGGKGGSGGIGGKGGGGIINGNGGTIIGGDGGDAGTSDGRGGRGARGGTERFGIDTGVWGVGRGGSAPNEPEYNRRLLVLTHIRSEYIAKFTEDARYINAGIEIVPIDWINQRLVELKENWKVTLGIEGYILPPLK